MKMCCDCKFENRSSKEQPCKACEEKRIEFIETMMAEWDEDPNNKWEPKGTDGEEQQ